MHGKREEVFIRNNAFSLYDLYERWPHPSTRTPALGVMQLTVFVDPSLHGHHYCTLSLSEPCPKAEKMIFLEIHQFYTFYPKDLKAIGHLSDLIKYAHIHFCLPQEVDTNWLLSVSEGMLNNTPFQDNNPLGTEKIVSIEFIEEQTREGCHYINEKLLIRLLTP